MFRLKGGNGSSLPAGGQFELISGHFTGWRPTNERDRGARHKCGYGFLTPSLPPKRRGEMEDQDFLPEAFSNSTTRPRPHYRAEIVRRSLLPYLSMGRKTPVKEGIAHAIFHPPHAGFFQWPKVSHFFWGVFSLSLANGPKR